MSTIFERVYTWKSFNIIQFFVRASKKHDVEYFTFELNGVKYSDYTRDGMVEIIQKYSLDLSKKKALLTSLLNMYIDWGLENGVIKKVEATDILGFTPENGWVLPDKNYFNGGSDLRDLFEVGLKKTLEIKADPEQAKKWMKQIYEATSIQYKDYMFAYFMYAPFAYALRRVLRVLAFLSLGGEAEIGKSAIEEFGSVKLWGHCTATIGSSIAKSDARVDALFTATTFPIFMDDSADLRPQLLGLMKRYTTVEEMIGKMNPDQTLKYMAMYCTPIMFSHNNLPGIYDDPPMRQRIITLFPEYITKTPNWNNIYNQIPNGYLGKYIIDISRNMTFQDLVDILNTIEVPECFNDKEGRAHKGRSKVLYKAIKLGCILMKKWFDIDLNIDEFPKLIDISNKCGNEDWVELVKQQINEGTSFVLNQYGILENPRKKSWVNSPITVLEHNVTKKLKLKGVMLSQDNVIDLAKRMDRKSREFNMRVLYNILSSEWNNVKYTTFYTKTGTMKGIFIPMGEYSDANAEAEAAGMTEVEMEPLDESKKPPPEPSDKSLEQIVDFDLDSNIGYEKQHEETGFHAKF
jgi:hypothetical protein